MSLRVIYEGWGGGNLHIQSLDGLSYTFNGLGEYRMLEIIEHGFMMHGRTSKTKNSTQIVAIVFAANESTVEIQVLEVYAIVS